MSTATRLYATEVQHYNKIVYAEEIDSDASPQRRLLYWLLQHPFQDCEDIALALQWHPSSAYRRIQQAIEQGLVEVIAYQCHRTKATSFYHLSPTGMHTIARQSGVSPHEVAIRWKQRDSDLLTWLPRLQSERALQQIINRTIKYWETSTPPQTQASWEWLHEYHNPFTHTPHKRAPVADAVLTFTRSDTYFHLFYLLDSGYAARHSKPIIQQRIQALLHFQKAFTHHYPGQPFSPMIIVTPSKQDRTPWIETINETLSACPDTQLDIFVTTYAYDEPLSTFPELTVVSSHQSSGSLYEKTPGTKIGLPYCPVEDDGSQPKAVIKGHFMQRAAQLTPDKERKIPEKEIIALLGLRLYRRHLDVLTILYHHSQLSRKDIAALLYIDEPTVRRSLSELIQWKCVTARNTQRGTFFCLTNRGQRFIAAQKERKPH
ncbi:MarR family transcriptional regulator [Dictyobacter kobayashii]|uniref:Uncharacterized protein n=1 Tax=Dictyobacter kobayashii TaxID=2014872 RepID=A0A402AVX2_9CHLR|nr:helix-turn-helix domain-containing protein [Dictyobacter kobayashii]GCE23229.1 hypothetical protein KDK_70290 [Dictyobacter kobayashii]